jgi:hypothetical protein
VVTAKNREAVAAATWLKSLAVASRPLQPRLAETNFGGS